MLIQAGMNGQQVPPDIMQFMMLRELKKMQDENGGTIGDGLGQSAKALRKLHSLKQEVYNNPRRIIHDYSLEVMMHLGAELGDPWQYYQYTAKIPWGKMHGLHRTHFHISHILALILRQQTEQAAAYAIQLLRATHQAQIDGGEWGTALHLLPQRDPIQRIDFGGTERELETIQNYKESLAKLRRGQHAKDPEAAKGGGKGGKHHKEQTDGQ